MDDLNLEVMSLGELRKLQRDIAKLIATHEDRKRAEARVKLEAIAKEMGFSLAELVAIEMRAPRRSATPKYRHPKNAVLVWSGRGRKPKWFIDHLNAGKDPSELAV